MEVVRDQIGATTVYIQTIDDYVNVVGVEGGEMALRPTGAREGALAAYASLKDIIRDVAQDVGSELGQLAPESVPEEVELEFNLGISSQLGPVWLCGKTESGVKVRLSWRLGRDA